MHNQKFVGTVKIGRKTYNMTVRGYFVVGGAGVALIAVGLYVFESVIYLLGGR